MQQPIEPNPSDNNANPYLVIYRSMNLVVTENVSRETAEEISRQLGYLYNAIGIVTKDLIKVVANLLPRPAPVPDQPPRRPRPPIPPYQQPPQNQPMEIEEPPQQQPSTPPPSHGQQKGQGNLGEGQGKLAGSSRDERELEVKPPNMGQFD